MPKLKINEQIDNLFALREKKRAYQELIDEIKKEIAEEEQVLIELLDSQGIEAARGDVAAVSISKNVKPNVEDWDEFYAYIHRNKYYHLLERRPSVSGCNELFQMKGRIPGVVPFVKRSLNLRSRS